MSFHTPPVLSQEEARNVLVLLSRLTTIQYTEVETVAALKINMLLDPPVLSQKEAKDVFVLLTRLTAIQFMEVETVALIKVKLASIVNFVEPTHVETEQAT